MFARQSAVKYPPQANRMRASSTVSTRYAETNERLNEFVRYFVKESETKLYSYHLILEGELHRSGKFTKAFSEIAGYAIGGGAGIVGAVFGLPSGGAKVLTQAGKLLGEKVGNRIGNETYAKQVRQLADFIKFSQKSKAVFRKTLVETGFDIFQSFEMQFMGVSVDESSSKALHVLAKDAINRAVSYLKKNPSATITEGVLLGESKRKDVDSLMPGFSLTYKSHSCKKTWNTGKLYSKVGLLTVLDQKQHFLRKKESNTDKYGYRRLFSGEKWDALSEVYKTDNIADSGSGHFTEYEYILDLTDMEVKCEEILKEIISNDKDLAEDKIMEVLAEVKEDILEEIKILKEQSQGYPEDRKILAKLEEAVNNFNSENFLKEMKQYFSEMKEEIAKLIKESSGDVVERIQIMSDDNKEQHRNTQATVERLNGGIETIQKEQKRTLKQIGELVDGMKKVTKSGETLVGQHQNGIPFWFDMRDFVPSFTGRQSYLDQIVKYVQNGMVIITGLSGVGKTELAIRYAHTQEKKYNNVIWVNAKDREALKHSFRRLYKKLGFKIEDTDVTEKDIKCIAEDVYVHFSRQRSLFVFDDVENYSAIKDLLPRGLPSDANKPHVLITAHMLEIEQGTTLMLGDFTIDESVHFIIKKLHSAKNSGEIRELAKKLHNFPLALRQAVAYISEADKSLKNIDPKKEFTISDYLEKFDRKTEDLLKCEVFQKLGSDYHKTTFTAFQITLGKIRSQKYSQQALELLHTMAYFSPDNIPALFFLEAVNEDEMKLGNIIQLLKDYSVVSGGGLLSIHGLVQHVVRLELAKKLEGDSITEESILHKALGMLKRHMTDYPTCEHYIQHIISVWSHASKYTTLIERFIVSYDPVTYTTYFNLIVQSSPFETVTNVIEKIEEHFPEELDKVINRECRNGITPLYCAAMSGDERKVSLLMSKGANVGHETKHKVNLLHVSAKKGYQETVQNLLQKGFSVDPRTEYNSTPLHLAVKDKHLEIVKFLLSQGADVTMKTNRGFTPLHFAVITGRIDIVETLLNNKAAVTDATRHQCTPLHLASKDGHLEVLKILLQSGANVEAKTRFKFTPLHFAAEKGHVTIVEVLLSEKAAVNVKDGNHFTPLHLAAFCGHNDVVLMLLKHGAQVNAKTTQGNTPLHFASEKGHLEVVKTLIASKGKLDIRNKEGKIALDLAVEKNFVEIKDLIIQHVTE